MIIDIRIVLHDQNHFLEYLTSPLERKKRRCFHLDLFYRARRVILEKSYTFLVHQHPALFILPWPIIIRRLNYRLEGIVHRRAVYRRSKHECPERFIAVAFHGSVSTVTAYALCKCTGKMIEPHLAQFFFRNLCRLFLCDGKLVLPASIDIRKVYVAARLAHIPDPAATVFRGFVDGKTRFAVILIQYKQTDIPIRGFLLAVLRPYVESLPFP